MCLANGSGGVLLVGVEDDGTPTGARPRHENGKTDVLRLQALIANNTQPPVATSVAVVELDGATSWRSQAPVVSLKVSVLTTFWSRPRSREVRYWRMPSSERGWWNGRDAESTACSLSSCGSGVPRPTTAVALTDKSWLCFPAVQRGAPSDHSSRSHRTLRHHTGAGKPAPPASRCSGQTCPARGATRQLLRKANSP